MKYGGFTDERSARWAYGRPASRQRRSNGDSRGGDRRHRRIAPCRVVARLSDGSPSASGSARRCGARSRAPARSFWWRARPGSARRGWRRMPRTAWRPRSSRAAPARASRRPTARSSPCCGRTCGRVQTGCRAWARCGGTWRCCCPSSGSLRLRVTEPRSSRRSALRSRRWPPTRHDWSCSMTFSGRTNPRSSSCRRSPSCLGAYRCCSWRSIAPMACRGATCCAGCDTSYGVAAASRSSSSAPLDGAQTAALVADILGETPAPSLAEAVYDRTQGIPFYVEELARALRRTDAIAPGPRRARARRWR